MYFRFSDNTTPAPTDQTFSDLAEIRLRKRCFTIMANKKPAYPPFGRDEVNVLNTCVNAGLEMEESEVSMDMCEAIQKIQERSEQQGEMKKAREMALSLASMGISVEKIAEAAKVSLDTVQKWLSGNMSVAK